MIDTGRIAAQLAISATATAMRELKNLPDDKASAELIRIVAGIYEHMRMMSGMDVSDRVDRFRSTKKLISTVMNRTYEETKNED